MNKEIRNIWMFGRTGGGKSTLANVLTGTDKFKESEGGVSETKDYQIETFDVDLGNGKIITYRIIDTIGIGDTKLSAETVLFKIAMIAREVKKDGINRILFVSSGRFTEAEAKAFKVLSEVIFDKEVFKHTTLVRSNFANFRDKAKRNEDIQLLKNINQTSFPIISEIIRADRNSIVHVDNPPLVGEEDEKAVALRNRRDSRDKLLAHLAENPTIYRPESIDDLGGKVEEHINKGKEEKEKVEKNIKELQDKLKEIQESRTSEREELERQLANLKDNLKKLEEEKKKLIAQEMAKHVEKKLTVTDMMTASVNMAKEGANTGAEIGTKVLPGLGTAAGALIGTGVGVIGAFTSAVVYFVNSLLGI